MKLPATIKYAILPEAQIVVDLLGQCAQYGEFHMNLVTCAPREFYLKMNSGTRSRPPILHPASHHVSPISGVMANGMKKAPVGYG